MERDRARLEAIGRIRAEALTLRARLLAIKAYRRSNNPAYVAMAVAEVLVGDYGSDTLVGVVQDGMVAGHLEGIARTQKNLSERGKGRRGLRLSSAYENALEFLRKRTGITAEQAVRLRESYGPAAAGAVQKATTAAVGKIGQALTESLQAGDGVTQGIKKLRTAFEDSGLTPGANYQLEQVFRTQTQLAYSAGRMNSLADPAVQEILWGFEYTTVGDDRVRPTHVAMDGVKAPKDDPIWQKWTPPNGYNCRCAILEVFDKGTSKPPTEPVEPDKGFAFNPGDITIDLPAKSERDPVPQPASGSVGKKSDPAEYKQQYEQWTTTLNGGEKSAIYHWENDPELVSDFRRIATGQPIDDPSGLTRKRFEDFKTAMAKAPRYEGVVYRGMADPDPAYLASFKPGEFVSTDAFASSTKDKDFAITYTDKFDQFGQIVPSELGVRVKIKALSGVDITGPKGPAFLKEQQEVILLPESKYKVVSRREVKRGDGRAFIELELEEILPAAADEKPTKAQERTPTLSLDVLERTKDFLTQRLAVPRR